MLTGNNSTYSRIAICCAFALFNCFAAQAQVDTTDAVEEEIFEEENIEAFEEIVEENDWVEYYGGFDFREGIYRSWQEFRMNAPSVPLASLVNSEGQAVSDLLTVDGRVFVLDSTGKRQRIPIDRIWGFCNDDGIYKNIRNGFQRIIMLGSLCHMMVEEWHVGGGLLDPGTPVRIQRLLNMRNGSYDVFHASSLAVGIRDDQQLYKEFLAIPPRKRNKDEVLFQFLRKYNQRNPLRFPPS